MSLVRLAGCSIALLALAGCGDQPPTPGDGGDGRAHVVITADHTAAMVSDRFLSFAVDTAQVVGGDFWNPGQTGDGGTAPVAAFDFARPRLGKLVAPLGHAWFRIGGTDADRTYYDFSDMPGPPPANNLWVLTRAQWDAANRFATGNDLQILFTLNAGRGPRVMDGPWHPDNARTLVEYATANKNPVGVWELGNEINVYDLALGFSLSPAAYAADLATARALVDGAAPGSRLAAPASAYLPIVGEVGGFLPSFLAANTTPLDIVSWHYYPQESQRCPANIVVRRATPTTMLDPQNLDEIDRWADVVEAARAGHSPSSEGWLGESGNAQCGGQPGVSDTFASGFWWLDQLGKLARRGVPVVIHQSLTGADYGLLTEPDLVPRPDYFNSLLWRRLMDRRVLDVTSPLLSLRAYAHCAATGAPNHRAGAVTVLLINLDMESSATIALDGIASASGDLYLLSAADLQSHEVSLNGVALVADSDGNPPAIAGVAMTSGTLVLPPASFAFVVLPDAAAAACQ
jgi:heparanase 1